MSFSFRFANQNDIKWINHTYRKLGFMLSNLHAEKIVIASFKNERVGVGRLVIVSDRVVELGGIYVAEKHRLQGVASKIVRFLLSEALPHQSIYCIAFKHLCHFYKRYGFTHCQATDTIPKELQEKWQRCLKIYQRNIELLEFNK